MLVQEGDCLRELGRLFENRWDCKRASGGLFQNCEDCLRASRRLFPNCGDCAIDCFLRFNDFAVSIVWRFLFDGLIVQTPCQT